MACILTCNVGSTNVKVGLFEATSLQQKARLVLPLSPSPLLQITQDGICAVSHRVVHGGGAFWAPTILNDQVIEKLHAYIPLAPLHQPQALRLIQEARCIYPDIPHIACFDTAFHHTISEEIRRFALPRFLHEEGVKRYGFHGLSYQSLVAQLLEFEEKEELKRIVAIHLGGGASACALLNFESIATTMGFSALDGLMMSTRCGVLDPGVLLYLLQEKKMSSDALTQMLYKESGLRGVSGMGGDMRELLTSPAREAQQAIALFCRMAAQGISSLLPLLGGLDALVFTGGIGEKSPEIRKQILLALSYLGVAWAEDRNQENALKIHNALSKVKIYILESNEEKILAQAAQIDYP